MSAPSAIGEFLARQVRLRRGDLLVAAAAGATTAAATTLWIGVQQGPP